MARCDQADACTARIEAVKAGRFELGTEGWRWLDAIRPDREWTLCPWCGRAMPGAEEIRTRVLGPLWRIRQADGADLAPDDEWEGEDGG